MKLSKINDIYISKVDGCWGGLIVNKRTKTIINANPDIKLIEFALYLKEEYPNYRIRCVRNFGVEEAIKKHQNIPQVYKGR